MPFTSRNARYLRISAHTVLPLYIYLDDKHIEWMTDYTLQRVLEDLRPIIGPKLRAENNLQNSGGSNAKKGTVDVHRGDTYQFAYFFRKHEPHAVLIKSRSFYSPASAQSPETPVLEPPPQPSRPRNRKHNGVKSKGSATKPTSKVRAKSKKRTRFSDSDEDEALERNDEGATSESAREGPARSLRKRTLMAGGYRETEGHGEDVMMVDSGHSAAEVDQDTIEGIVENNSLTTAQNTQDYTIVPEEPRFSPVFNIDTEGEEEKPKLSMRVTYQGFTIYDRCLCVIIEPWPALRDRSRMRSVVPFIARDSVNPTVLGESTPVASVRERTPLFLPDLDPRRSTTPAPLPSRFLPPVPLFDDNDSTEPGEEDATDEGGMVAFSQVLNSASGERAGSADEDENEGDVFLGDADERRGDL